MIITVSKQEFCARVTELLALVEGGAEVIVRGPDKTEAMLVPMQTPAARREWKFNLHPGAWKMRDDFDDPIDEEDFLKGNL